GDLLFVPRAVRLLRTQKVTQTALNARPIQIPAGADAHDRPGCLRCGAWADAFGGWIFVRATAFAPAAVAVLAALEPITSAQNPVLRHVFTGRRQPAQHLPCAINVIHSPSSVPRPVVILGGDQIFDRVSDALGVAIKTNVAK